jgi:hypothetical protein
LKSTGKKRETVGERYKKEEGMSNLANLAPKQKQKMRMMKKRKSEKMKTLF